MRFWILAFLAVTGSVIDNWVATTLFAIAFLLLAIEWSISYDFEKWKKRHNLDD